MLDGNGPNNLSGKTLVLVITYNMEDPDGVYLAIQMFRSIAAWAGMDLVVLKYNATDEHVSGAKGKFDEAYRLGYSLRVSRGLCLRFPAPLKAARGCSARLMHSPGI